MPTGSGVPEEENLGLPHGFSTIPGDFNCHDGVTVDGSPTIDSNGKENEEAEVNDRYNGDRAPHINDGDAEEGDAGSKETDGVSSAEMTAIIRQAKNEFEKNLAETRSLAEELFGELSTFLEESEAIQKDFGEVQTIVHEESTRLDRVEPQVLAFSEAANVL